MTHFYIGLFHNLKKKKKKTLLLEIDQQIFNMMLAKSMHQIARIEFRNSKFPYARGLCPLATPAKGLCPLDPHQGASPMEPPSLVNNLSPPFPAAGSAPDWCYCHIVSIFVCIFCYVKLQLCHSTNKIQEKLICCVHSQRKLKFLLASSVLKKAVHRTTINNGKIN